MNLRLTIASILAFLAGSASIADAASGVITGVLRFKQEQGNYCPNITLPSRSCTGARYLESEYLTYQPIRNVKVFVKNDANGSIIGQGSTGADGTFQIQWSSGSNVTSATIYWVAEHSGGRYYITDMNGTKRQFSGWSGVALTSGTTATSPQDFGLRGWGGPTAAAIIANVNDGARRMWTDSLSASSLMVDRFNNLKIMTFNTGSSGCPSSCANGKDNRVTLGAGDEYAPQASIMHEMGHIAVHKANSHGTITAYCYPDTDGDCGWTFNEPEWRATAFEEGFATFLGDRALYWQNAPEPYTCSSVGYCPSNYSTEFSLGDLCNFTTTKHDRQPIQVIRFLRDLYDSVSDSRVVCNGDICFTVTDNVSRSFSSFFAVFDAYPSCFGDHCDDEPWDRNWLGLPYIDDRDGRSGADFLYHFEAVTGVDGTSAHVLNCEP